MKHYLSSLLADPKNFIALRYGEGFDIEDSELGEFHLQASFAGSGTLREDIKNQHGAINDLATE